MFVLLFELELVIVRMLGIGCVMRVMCWFEVWCWWMEMESVVLVL